MNYKIILDEKVLDAFIESLPELTSNELFYLCLFGRHKYDNNFPNTKDSGQLVRTFAADKFDLKMKIRRMEVPLGCYQRDGIIASNECLATYIAINPRSLIKANKEMMIEMTKRLVNGELNFNPVSLSNTSIHRAVSRKMYVDFDFDILDSKVPEYIAHIKTVIPPDSFRVMKTRGGIHCLVNLEKIKSLRTNWYVQLAALPNCDVKGVGMLTPVPGCTQGGFSPYFIE